MDNKERDVQYLARDFNDYKKNLVEFTKTYFPNTYNDFSPTSVGTMFLENVAYLSDILSFYQDNQLQESFATLAKETANQFNHAYIHGYTPKVTRAATSVISFYQTVPSKTVGFKTVPDFNYALNVPANTLVRSTSNPEINFLISDFIDFSVSSSIDPTDITVFENAIATGEPTYYTLRKERKSISATIKTIEFTFGNNERFPTRLVEDENIIGILDIVDSDGNNWYEVPYLAQEMVFDGKSNSAANYPVLSQDQNVKYILTLKKEPRRYVTRFKNSTTLELQWGAGNIDDKSETIVPNLSNIGIGLPFERSKLTTAFDTLNFLYTDTYGISPRNTTLTVRYLVGGGVSSNVPANDLTNIVGNNYYFVNSNLPSGTLTDSIYDSLTATNLQAAKNGGEGDTTEELRQKTLSAFQTQLRTVTDEDYQIRALSLPSEYGAIAKAFVKEPERSSNSKSFLDLFILTYDINKRLTLASPALKHNLRTYLSQYNHSNDVINIRDAYIVNIGINFDIVTIPGVNSNEVLLRCVKILQEYFNTENWQINQPIVLQSIYLTLDRVKGVQTVKDVQIVNKVGISAGYSEYAYNVDGATVEKVVFPSQDPCIFEVKYPSRDIVGRVVNL